MLSVGQIKARIHAMVDRRLGPEFSQRCRNLAVAQNEYGYDPFGFHRDSLRYPMLVARWLYRHYFRCQAHGLENLPAEGRCMLVANHSGQLPFDATIIITASFIDAPHPRLVRSMVERFIPMLPFVSYFFSRWGQITGTPENCRRLLENEEAILVFPEGAAGISKPFSQRYCLAHFGHGFMRLALETKTPIVPVAVIGAEEQAPAINLKPVARLLGAPAFPVVPYPPFVPIVPLPVKYHLYVGEPMQFSGDPDEDEEALEEKSKTVQHRIQSLIHLGLRERKHVFR